MSETSLELSGLAILAVFAHPDDEGFGCGGTLAMLAARGARVTLVCATNGDVGEISQPTLATPETLALVRRDPYPRRYSPTWGCMGWPLSSPGGILHERCPAGDGPPPARRWQWSWPWSGAAPTSSISPRYPDGTPPWTMWGSMWLVLFLAA